LIRVELIPTSYQCTVVDSTTGLGFGLRISFSSRWTLTYSDIQTKILNFLLYYVLYYIIRVGQNQTQTGRLRLKSEIIRD
jgi:hypothetical protein